MCRHRRRVRLHAGNQRVTSFPGPKLPSRPATTSPLRSTAFAASSIVSFFLSFDPALRAFARGLAARPLRFAPLVRGRGNLPDSLAFRSSPGPFGILMRFVNRLGDVADIPCRFILRLDGFDVHLAAIAEWKLAFRLPQMLGLGFQ